MPQNAPGDEKACQYRQFCKRGVDKTHFSWKSGDKLLQYKLRLTVYINTMDPIEKRTPKGISIKIIQGKEKFIAFEKSGASIYADSVKTKLLHNIPIIVFIGDDFVVKNPQNESYFFCKYMKGKIILPYHFRGNHQPNYLFIKMESQLDLMPVKLSAVRDVPHFIKEIESGIKPDYIIVNRSITKDDILIIKNRYSAANIILADGTQDITLAGDRTRPGEGDDSERRATDLAKEVNLNMLSDNPVFLARIHLRDMELSKVNQLLLDFDISAVDAEYILRFIDTMISRSRSMDDLKRELPMLEKLRDSFLFYINLMTKEKDTIRELIDKVDEQSRVASYLTLIAKVKLFFPDKEDRLLMTEYENILMEKKEQLTQ